MYYAVRAPHVTQRPAAEWRGACPVHHGKNENFAVDPETGRWFCHSQCGRGGDVFDLEAELSGGDFPARKSEIFRLVGRSEPECQHGGADTNGKTRPRRIVETYDYTDERGALLYQAVRYEPKGFSQRRPDGHGGWVWNLLGIERVPYRLPKVLTVETVYLVEGERDVHTVEGWGLVASCNSEGAGKFRPVLAQYFAGKNIVILPDNDEPGRKHAAAVAVALLSVAASVRIVELPGLPAKGDVTDWRDIGGTFEQFKELVGAAAQIDAAALSGLRARWGLTTEPKPGGAPAGNDAPAEGSSEARCDKTSFEKQWAAFQAETGGGDVLQIGGVVETFQKWLYLPDPGVVHVTLATVAANLLDGPPLWLLLVGAPGSGKTETTKALACLPGLHGVATLTEGSLLSGTAKRDRTKDATGGLLREIGDFGIIIAKDFTSVLAMNQESRSAVLAALREIYDGEWTRRVGTDGGRALHWQGKVGFIGSVTPVLDQHQAVIASMGERFICYRLPGVDPEQQALRAIENSGRYEELTRALAGAVAALFRQIKPERQDRASMDDIARFVALAALAARCRSAVVRDGRTREVELVPEPEMPARLAKALISLDDGLAIIGTDPTERWRLVSKVALDSLPALRRRILFEAIGSPTALATTDFAVRVQHPTTTVRRALEDLAAHGILRRVKAGKADVWQVTARARGWWDMAAIIVPEKSEGDMCDAFSDRTEGE